MEITTKFNVSDTLWTVRECKAIQFNVARIHLSKDGISYWDEEYHSHPEENCFATKDELIKHLFE